MEDVERDVDRLRRILVMIKPTDDKITITDIRDCMRKIDLVEARILGEKYDRFYDVYRQEMDSVYGEGDHKEEFESFLRTICAKTLGATPKRPFVYNSQTSKTLFNLYSVYDSLVKYMPAVENDKTGKVYRPASEILYKVAGNKFFSDDKVANSEIDDILSLLTDEDAIGHFNTFDSNELAVLIKKASTILFESSRYKINFADEVIHSYASYLRFNADDEFSRLVDDNIVLKTLALKSGSFLSLAPERMTENYQLLTGRSLDKLDKGVRYDNAVEQVMFGGVKLNVNPHQLYHILTQNTSILSSLSSAKVLSMARDFEEIISRVFADRRDSLRFKREDFRIEQYLTGNNIVDLLLLSKEDGIKTDEYRESMFSKFATNIETLSTIMGSKAVFKIMQNNISILNMDCDLLRDTLESMRNECGQDFDLLTEKVNEFVNTKMPLVSKKTVFTPFPKGREKGNAVSVNTKMEDVKDDFSEFEISLDMGKWKFESFSEGIKRLSIGELFELLGDCSNKIKEGVEGRQLITEDTVRITVSKCKSIIARIQTLISQAESNNSFVAESWAYSLRSLKTTLFSDIIKYCKGRMAEISSEFGADAYARGRDAGHVDTREQAGSVAQYISMMKNSAKSIDSEEARSVAEEGIQTYANATSEINAAEHRMANKERIDGYNTAMGVSGDYSLYATTVNALESLEM